MDFIATKLICLSKPHRSHFHHKSLKYSTFPGLDFGNLTTLAVMVLHSSRFLVLSMISTSLIFNSWLRLFTKFSRGLPLLLSPSIFPVTTMFSSPCFLMICPRHVGLPNRYCNISSVTNVGTVLQNLSCPSLEEPNSDSYSYTLIHHVVAKHPLDNLLIPNFGLHI